MRANLIKPIQDQLSEGRRSSFLRFVGRTVIALREYYQVHDAPAEVRNRLQMALDYFNLGLTSHDLALFISHMVEADN